MEKPPQFTQVKAPPLVKSQFNNAIEEDLAHLPYKENVPCFVNFISILSGGSIFSKANWY